MKLEIKINNEEAMDLLETLVSEKNLEKTDIVSVVVKRVVLSLSEVVLIQDNENQELLRKIEKVMEKNNFGEDDELENHELEDEDL